MTKQETEAQNEQLIALLSSLRDQIEEAFEEFGIAPDDNDSSDNDGDE
jgi:hypothetical protein